MTGKLIHNLKRKREEESNLHPSSAVDPPQPAAEDSGVKRERLDTPAQPKSAILLEALQKIMELQNELERLENDLDEEDEEDEEQDYSDSEDAEVSFYLNEQNEQNARHEAEALGFAMCARETLLFLQSEGIAPNSAIYQTLKEKLVGGSQGIPI